MTQAFVYKWTQLSTQKWYIGSRTAKNCHIDDGYICSSKTVKPLVLENKDDWTREILASGTRHDMVNFETDILIELDAKNDPTSFNKHNNDGIGSELAPSFKNGHTPWNKGINGKDSHSYGYVATLATKTKLSKSQQGENNSMYGATPWNKGIKTGKKWYTDGTVSKQYKIGKEPEGFSPGRRILSKDKIRSLRS